METVFALVGELFRLLGALMGIFVVLCLAAGATYVFIWCILFGLLLS